MTKPKLPISIQNFAEIRDPQNNCIYVDKTKQIIDFIDQGKSVYLSRPRRFGKSLMLDTMQCLFECRRDLFTGLYADSDDVWDWDKAHPVIKIDCSGMICNSVEQMERKWCRIFSQICDYHCIDYADVQDADAIDEFENLILAVSKKYGVSAVVIVDEYDFPLVHNLDNPELARAMQKVLGGIYSKLKNLSGALHYVMVSGVSKFMKLSLFSMANQLNDLSIDDVAATVCGYTHQEILDNFTDYLEGIDLERMRLWYNGYNYLGEPLYNPYDILLLLQKREFRNYWWQTGGTTILSHLLKSQKLLLPNIEGKRYTDELLNAFDIEKENLVALLWQSGYLTFEDKVTQNGLIKYKMKYPNFEVQYSLNRLFLSELTEDDMIDDRAEYLIQALSSHDPEQIKMQINALLASLPHHSYTNNDMANYEGYYSNIIYAFFYYLTAYRASTELVTQNGRIDFALEGVDEIFVIEYKVKGSAQVALAQVKEKNYAQRYMNSGKAIYQMGICFDKALRLVDELKIERVTCYK